MPSPAISPISDLYGKSGVIPEIFLLMVNSALILHAKFTINA
jgi:hypothetical protein